MKELLLSYAPIIFGLLSSAFWLGASFVKIPYGYDCDPNPANKLISRLNAIAAIFATIAICSQMYSIK